jgi:hypothetical protein
VFDRTNFITKFITGLELSSKSKMLTRDNEGQSKEEKRDLELENIVGNLLIAEYQVDRLRTRLTELVSGYRVQMNKNKKSTHRKQENLKRKQQIRFFELVVGCL